MPAAVGALLGAAMLGLVGAAVGGAIGGDYGAKRDRRFGCQLPGPAARR